MVLKVENHDYLAKKTAWWLARQANIVGADKMLEIVVYCAKSRKKTTKAMYIFGLSSTRDRCDSPVVRELGAGQHS